MKKQYFITGTDTGVGKTYVTGLLAQALDQSGQSVTTQKWVQTGTLIPEDVHHHDQAMGRAPSVSAGDPRSPYCFLDPVSPHLAGDVDVTVLIQAFQHCCEQADVLLVEGAGGLAVPLSKNLLMYDFVKQLGVPVILVAENRVGGINHALLSVLVLHQHQIPIQGLIWNQVSAQVPPAVVQDNPLIVDQFLRNRGHQIPFKQLPYQAQDGKICLDLLD